jgi:hypothetical protein
VRASHIHPHLSSPLPEIRGSFIKKPDLYTPLEEVMDFDAKLLLQLFHLCFRIRVGDVIIGPPVLDAEALVVQAKTLTTDVNAELVADDLYPFSQGLKPPSLKF